MASFGAGGKQAPRRIDVKLDFDLRIFMSFTMGHCTHEKS